MGKAREGESSPTTEPNLEDDGAVQEGAAQDSTAQDGNGNRVESAAPHDAEQSSSAEDSAAPPDAEPSSTAADSPSTADIGDGAPQQDESSVASGEAVEVVDLSATDESESSEGSPPGAADESASVESGAPASGETSATESAELESAELESAESESREPEVAGPDDATQLRVDPQAAAAAVAAGRDSFVAKMFAEERPHPSVVAEVTSGYLQAFEQAAQAQLTDAASEASQLTEAARQRHAELLEEERAGISQAGEQAVQHVAAYEDFYVALGGQADFVQEELAVMNSEDDRFQAAPEALRAALANYKQGVEIIHRMFSRTKDRKKELTPERPFQLVEELSAVEPPSPDGLPAFLTRLSNSFYQVRDANYHEVQGANRFVEDCQKAVGAAAKAIFPALDGIDSGRANEPQTKQRLLEEHAEHEELISAWFGRYEKLRERSDEFVAQVGLSVIDAKRGDPFDPERMEPQGTIEDSELNDEDVALVARRGFVLSDVILRPAIVEVVKNS